jgi:signal transduction histidine kinase
MLFNLINDLLDLAKLENNSFSFSNDYFSLANIVFEAFQMLGFSATERQVDLKAIIDSQVNLSMIQSIHGDSRRFL